MVDEREARARAHGRTMEEQERADRHADPAKTWGKRNPTAMSGNPQNPDADDPERGDEGHRGTQGRDARPHEETKGKRPSQRPGHVGNMTRTDRASGQDDLPEEERHTTRR